MLVMYLGWKALKRTRVVALRDMDLETDRYSAETLDEGGPPAIEGNEKSVWRERGYRIWRWVL